MHRFSILFKKEFRQLFLSFPGFISLTFSPLFLSLFFIVFMGFFSGREADLSLYFGLYPTLFIMIIPIITLKLFIDDNRYNTGEVLLTLPFSENILVFARFCAIYLFFSILILGTMILPLSLIPLGNFDKGILLSNVIGILISGSASISLCYFLTVLVSGSIVSWFLSATALFFLFGSYGGQRFISSFFFSSHLESFSRGLLNSGDILFFILVTAIFLYSSTRLIYMRRWN